MASIVLLHARRSRQHQPLLIQGALAIVLPLMNMVSLFNSVTRDVLYNSLTLFVDNCYWCGIPLQMPSHIWAFFFFQSKKKIKSNVWRVTWSGLLISSLHWNVHSRCLSIQCFIYWKWPKTSFTIQNKPIKNINCIPRPVQKKEHLKSIQRFFFFIDLKSHLKIFWGRYEKKDDKAQPILS